MRLRERNTRIAVLACLLAAPASGDGPADTLDLAATPTTSGLQRVHGSIGDGSYGVAVAGGHDMDGDGFGEVALAAMRASTPGGAESGRVFLVFGTGTISGAVNTAVEQSGVLRIDGAMPQEHAGSELWMDDVTGDGRGDLIICRQDFGPGYGGGMTPPARAGAGAVTIVPGSAALRAHAATLAVLDLAGPPGELLVTHLVGDDFEDRFGIWARTGDVDGDGTADLVIGADRRTVYPGGACGSSDCDNGVVYVVRGGAHLASGATFDFADFGQPAFGLAGQALEIRPPSPAIDWHFGATVQAADLDGNGRSEILAAATLNRAGASLAPLGGTGNGLGGAPGGRIYTLWDDAIPAPPWAAGLSLVVNAAAASATEIGAGLANSALGEELLGGLDYDADGHADLFVGDLTGDGGNGTFSGLAYVFYRAADLKGTSFTLDTPPPGNQSTEFRGPRPSAIAADTATHGDFDGDGVADLAFASPHDQPLGRFHGGTLHVVFGQRGPWPELVDLSPGDLPPPDLASITEVYGANGASGSNDGDTLGYSAAAGDLDADGQIDLISNEMQGDGVSLDDTGNLIVLSGALLERHVIFQAAFEIGDTRFWSSTEP